MTGDISEFKGKKYRAVNFVTTSPDDVACNHCVFELGKCRSAIFALGQCYVKDGDDVIVNVYYEDVVE